MKRWLLTFGVMGGLLLLAAVMLSISVDWPKRARLAGEDPAASGRSAAHPARERVGTGNDLLASLRDGKRQTRGSMTPPGNVDALLAALAIHRPAEPPEAPDFSLLNLEGQPVGLSDLRGKLVFLNFWATWCPPCRLEMPSMERLYQTFKETEFAMLAVSIDRQGAEVVKPFTEHLNLTFPTLLDSTSEVARQYGLRGLPTTYLIGQDGRLLGAAVGGRDWSSAEAKALMGNLLGRAATTGKETDQGEKLEDK